MISGLLPGFEVVPADVDASGFGRYSLKLDRSVLTAGATGELTIEATTSLGKSAAIPARAFKAVRSAAGGQDAAPLTVVVFRNGSEVGRGSAVYANGVYRLQGAAAQLGFSSTRDYTVRASFTDSTSSGCGAASVCNHSRLVYTGGPINRTEGMRIRF